VFFAFLSALAVLLSALFGILGWAGWAAAMTVLVALFLLPVAVALLWQPMQAPTLGLLVTVVAVIAILAAAVLQVLVLAGWLGAGSARSPLAWAVFLIGCWLFLISYWQLGAPGLPAWVHWIGLAAGVAIAATGAGAMVSSPFTTAARLTGVVLYLAWAVGVGIRLWMQHRTQQHA